MRAFFSLACCTLFACVLIVAGCAPAGLERPPLRTEEDVILASYRIAEQLDMNMETALPPKAVVIAASFVNVDDLAVSSTLGRVLAEQIASRLDQLGYETRELKLRTDSIYIQEATGEFLLSRDLKLISKEHDASAALVGTYGLGADAVYITAKLVQTTDGAVLSSCDHALVLYGRDRDRLLRGDGY